MNFSTTGTYTGFIPMPLLRQPPPSIPARPGSVPAGARWISVSVKSLPTHASSIPDIVKIILDVGFLMPVGALLIPDYAILTGDDASLIPDYDSLTGFSPYPNLQWRGLRERFVKNLHLHLSPPHDDHLAPSRCASKDPSPPASRREVPALSHTVTVCWSLHRGR